MKNATKVRNEIQNKKVIRAKTILNGIYTKTSKEISKLLESAEKNAIFNGMKTEQLFVNISINKGFAFYRPKSRARLRRRKAKNSKIEIILNEEKF